MAYFEIGVISTLYDKYENETISVLWNQGNFEQPDIQLYTILKTEWFRKSPKTKTDRFRLKIEIGLISAILKHKKSQGYKNTLAYILKRVCD